MPVMHRIWLLLLPELRSFSPDERGLALARAHETPADIAELVGMAFAVVAVAVLTQYSLLDAGALARFAATAVNFAVALPLMALAVGPFHLRRWRRGLRLQRQTQGQHE